MVATSRTVDSGRMTERRKWRERGWKSGRRKAESGRRKSEKRKAEERKAKSGKRKAESGRRKAESGKRKAEGGRRKAESGSGGQRRNCAKEERTQKKTEIGKRATARKWKAERRPLRLRSERGRVSTSVIADRLQCVTPATVYRAGFVGPLQTDGFQRIIPAATVVLATSSTRITLPVWRFFL